jgi:hypothetical protein
MASRAWWRAWWGPDRSSFSTSSELIRPRQRPRSRGSGQLRQRHGYVSTQRVTTVPVTPMPGNPACSAPVLAPIIRAVLVETLNRAVRLRGASTQEKHWWMQKRRVQGLHETRSIMGERVCARMKQEEVEAKQMHSFRKLRMLPRRALRE